ncbi:MAG: exodeoxyribonuclease VII small subunit [Candidatus Latescibacterota bacterium]
MMARRSFEDALKILEEVVEGLETGGASLDASLDLFERGVGASRECTEILSVARKRVQKLVEKQEGVFQLGFLEEVGSEGA